TRKDAPADAGSAAEHLRFPRVAAGGALDRDRIVDAEEAVTLFLRHAQAILPQRTRRAIAVRRTFLQDIQQTPVHHRHISLPRLIENPPHQSIRPMMRGQRLDRPGDANFLAPATSRSTGIPLPLAPALRDELRRFPDL